MKALFAYYTGTGNTLRALGRIAEVLSASGYLPEWLEIRAGGPPLGQALTGLCGEDLFVLGFPALGFSAPSPVLRALRSLPPLPGLRIAVLCACSASPGKSRVSNGWSGTAIPEALGILVRKGALPVGSVEASYPTNWTQLFPPGNAEDIKAMVSHGDAQARDFAFRLAGSRAVGLEAPTVSPRLGPGLSVGHVRRSPVSRVLGPLISRAFRSVGRPLLSRLFVADRSCTSCGLCERTCPTGAIRMRGSRPSWSISCSACNRCINLCPERSIQTSYPRLVLILGLNLAALILSVPVASTILNLFPTREVLLLGGAEPIVLGLGLYLGFSLFQTFPLDLGLRLLERIRALDVLFSRGSTMRFGRYLAPGFKPEGRE